MDVALIENIRQICHSMAESGTLPAPLGYGFVVNAVICTLILGPVLGAMGTLVVVKKMAFFSQAIGQAAMTGVAIGIMLGEPHTSPYISLFSFCLIFGLIINYTKNRGDLSSDVLIGVYLSLSLAVGSCILLWIASKVNVHLLDSVLFGSILTVDDLDIAVLAGVSLLEAIFFYFGYKTLVLSSFDPLLARTRGISVTKWEYIFTMAITILTVASVKIVGAILVEALLLIPAAAARNVSRSMRGFLLVSVITATLSCLTGVILPVCRDIPVPSGSAIILTASSFFILSLMIRGIKKCTS